MIIAFNALIPIICLILVGTILKRIAFFDDALWPSLEKLSYYVLMPILLISILSTKSIENMPWREIALVVDIPVLIVALFFWVTRSFLKNTSAERFTSLFQGGVRFNTFVGLALAQGLYGEEGVIIGALASGFMIVLINFLCVLTFSIALKKEGHLGKKVFFQIVKNPLIISCLVGWSINISGLHLPEALNETMIVLGRASLPIALMTVGAALQFKAFLQNGYLSIFVGIIQFGMKPLSAALCCYIFGLSGITAITLTLFLATPTAPSSYILSRQLGGDHQVMASLITQQTLFAFFSLPITIWILNLYF